MLVEKCSVAFLGIKSIRLCSPHPESKGRKCRDKELQKYMCFRMSDLSLWERYSPKEHKTTAAYGARYIVTSAGPIASMQEKARQLKKKEKEVEEIKKAMEACEVRRKDDEKEKEALKTELKEAKENAKKEKEDVSSNLEEEKKEHVKTKKRCSNEKELNEAKVEEILNQKIEASLQLHKKSAENRVLQREIRRLSQEKERHKEDIEAQASAYSVQLKKEKQESANAKKEAQENAKRHRDAVRAYDDMKEKTKNLESSLKKEEKKTEELEKERKKLKGQVHDYLTLTNEVENELQKEKEKFKKLWDQHQKLMINETSVQEEDDNTLFPTTGNSSISHVIEKIGEANPIYIGLVSGSLVGAMLAIIGIILGMYRV